MYCMPITIITDKGVLINCYYLSGPSPIQLCEANQAQFASSHFYILFYFIFWGGNQTLPNTWEKNLMIHVALSSHNFFQLYSTAYYKLGFMACLQNLVCSHKLVEIRYLTTCTQYPGLHCTYDPMKTASECKFFINVVHYYLYTVLY